MAKTINPYRALSERYYCPQFVEEGNWGLEGWINLPKKTLLLTGRVLVQACWPIYSHLIQESLSASSLNTSVVAQSITKWNKY